VTATWSGVGGGEEQAAVEARRATADARPIRRVLAELAKLA
jgi:hypothetical protein